MVIQGHVQKNKILFKKFKTQDLIIRETVGRWGQGIYKISQYFLPIYSVSLKLLFKEIY